MTDTDMIALEGARVIDGTGREPVAEGVVTIRASVIEQVGPRNEVRIPTGCRSIDVSGKTVMPGMIDCHLHPSVLTVDIGEDMVVHKTVRTFQTAEVLRRTLRAGFTTVREAGVLNDVGFREAVERGLIEGPRLVMAGTVGQVGGQWHRFFPSGAHFPLEGVELASGVDEVQRATRLQLQRGFDFIKVSATGDIGSPAGGPDTTEFTIEELKAVVYEAKARGKAVMAHAHGSQGVKNAVAAGVWSVEHGTLMDDEAIDLLLKTGTYLVPTMLTFDELVERGPELGLSELSLAKLQRVKDSFAGTFRKVVRAGVKVGVGTDICFDSCHGTNARELELMVRGGLSPMRAIVAATKTSSEVCRIDHKVGTLEPGKLADLLVVDGDPLDDIAVLQDPSSLAMVMKEGRPVVESL